MLCREDPDIEREELRTEHHSFQQAENIIEWLWRTPKCLINDYKILCGGE
jgi:hypothetical protein